MAFNSTKRTTRASPSPLQLLIQSTFQGLPLPQALIRDSAESFANPVTLLELKHHYESLKINPAWRHFLGRLLEMKTLMEAGILRGERDRFGNDVTDKMRVSYGVLLQILAIPGQITTIQRETEHALVGVPQENEFES